MTIESQEQHDRALHFLLRYSNELYGHDTIREHQTLLDAKGSVWMGKFGLGVANHFVEKANGQIERSRPTYLYLNCQSKTRLRATLVRVVGGGVSHRSLCPEVEACPTYYSQKPCSIWFKVKEIVDCTATEIAALRLYNDPYSAPAFTSMRGLVYVTDSVGTRGPPHAARSKRRAYEFDDLTLAEGDW